MVFPGLIMTFQAPLTENISLIPPIGIGVALAMVNLLAYHDLIVYLFVHFSFGNQIFKTTVKFK